MIDMMIDLGLENFEKWPSQDHKIVAQNVCLCNPRINSRNKLMEVCSVIIRIPNDKIRIITRNQIRYMKGMFGLV
jgi:hypothetical protein